MEKRTLIIYAAVAFALIVLLTLILSSRGSSPEVSETKAIPTNSAVYFEIHNVKKLVQKLQRGSNVFASVAKVKQFAGFVQKLNSLQALFEFEEADRLFEARKCFVSITADINNTFSSLYIFPQLDEGVVDEIEAFIPETKRLESYEYEKASIGVFQTKGKRHYYCQYRGFLLYSASRLSIESSLRQLNSKYDIRDNPLHEAVKETASSSADLNLYINHKEFSKLLSIFAHPRYRKPVRENLQLSDWTELDVDIEENIISLNGLSHYQTNKKNYFFTHRGSDAQEVEIAEILPSSTAFFELMSWDRFQEYLELYKRNLNSKGSINAFRKRVFRINQKIGIDLEKLLHNLVDNQVANLFCNRGATSLKRSNYLAIKLKSQSIAFQTIRDLVIQYCKTNRLRKDDYISYFQFDEGTRFPIFKLPFKELGGLFFGDFFGLNDQNFCCFYGSYMILGETAADVSYFLKMNTLNATLANDTEYKSIQEHSSSSANIQLYLNLKKSLSLLRHFLNQELRQTYEQNTNHLNKIQAINYQAKNESDMMFQTVSILFNSEFSNNETKTPIWETNVNAPVHMKPVFVKNHRTQEYELFVQDSKNEVYLINKAGRILWSRQLESPILGKVQQVDLYRNNKLQYAFNTTENLYVLDRNGNFVEPFPIKIPGKASNGVSVFDYDKSRDYRFVLATKQRRILMYDRKGAPVKGWRFSKTESLVQHPVEHFRVRSKDFIVATDRNRVYILNRMGKTRVKVMQTIARAKASPIYLLPKASVKDSKLVFTDAYGKLISVYFSGNTKQLVLDKFSRDHLFVLGNLDADAEKEYVFADYNELEVYKGKERLFKKEFDSKVLAVHVYRFSRKDVKIGVHTENGKVFLVGTDGETQTSFPLKSGSPFSVGKFHKRDKYFSLVLGSPESKVNNYEYIP